MALFDKLLSESDLELLWGHHSSEAGPVQCVSNREGRAFANLRQCGTSVRVCPERGQMTRFRCAEEGFSSGWWVQSRERLIAVEDFETQQKKSMR